MRDRRRHLTASTTALVVLGLIAGLVNVGVAAAANPNLRSHGGRYLVVAKSHADYAALRGDAIRSGATIEDELTATDTLVISGSPSAATTIASSAHAQTVAADRIETLSPPEGNGARQTPHAPHGNGGGGRAVVPDPAFSLPGLMWNVSRINAQKAWRATTGDPTVIVGVADTGLDYTHSELASQVVHVKDFTGAETPPICKTFFSLPTPTFPSSSMGDAELAAAFGAPADTDWNGHGSWIGGNIAAALDGVGINGIAPKVKLVSLKISQWCGAAYDSEILASFQYAADHGINVVSISFGGYLDRSDPDQDVIYKQYVGMVAYARSKGTVIVASAGNEHARIGQGGRVLSHGILWIPGDIPDPVNNPIDFFGFYEVPGGVPGVVDVSATGNVVAGPSRFCPADTTGADATCKPASDAHQARGIGREDQLTYYSNYGPRIDVAAPGGARKFNLPAADRGGTAGWPVTTIDRTTAFEDFSITSNWALEIPCYFNLGPQFYPNECYSTIQGTSMATPHASAVVALIASARPWIAHNPDALVRALKESARDIHGNTTQGLSAMDTSPGDRTGLACPTGYCHLGGPAISDQEAYGAGLVDAGRAVSGGR